MISIFSSLVSIRSDKAAQAGHGSRWCSADTGATVLAGIAGSRLAMCTGSKLLQADKLLSSCKCARSVVSMKLGMCTTAVDLHAVVLLFGGSASAVHHTRAATCKMLGSKFHKYFNHQLDVAKSMLIKMRSH